MITYISILRGINVSGHNIIKMDQLKKLIENLGFENVHTYIQSGNLIYQTKKTAPIKLSERIKNSIQKEFGFDVPVFTITSETLEVVIKNNPFQKDINKDAVFFHVTFLSAIPAQEKIEILKSIDSKNDIFEIVEQAMYLYCPNGYGNTKLTNTFVESKLKASATTRNWKTTNELLNSAKKISKIQNV
jgi:uncharacterized protein (DUF1697 family)